MYIAFQQSKKKTSSQSKDQLETVITMAIVNGKIPGPVPGTYGMMGNEYRQRQRIVGAFEQAAGSYGYEPIELPPFYPSGTYIGKVIARKDGGLVGKVVTQLDSPNQLVELAYELTMPVAMILLEASSGDVSGVRGRFFYNGAAFRMEDPEKIANARERYIAFRQLGIENLTSGPVEGVAESIALYIEFLAGLNLSGTVRIANVELMRNILDDYRVTEYQRTAVIKLMEERKILALEGYLCQQGFPNELMETIKKVLQISTSPVEAIGELRSDFQKYSSVADELEQLVDLLNVVGAAKFISIDQSAQRGLAFYKKFGLQGDVEGSREVMGGGDYVIDVPVSGKSIVIGGSGFGIGLERLETEYAKAADPPIAETQRVLLFGTDVKKVLRAQRTERDTGRSVETFFGPEDDARAYAQLREIGSIVKIDVGDGK